jgi:hypothetical protein
VKIKSGVTLEQVSELSPNLFRDSRIKEQMICTIFIHFVPFLNISYTFLSKAGNNFEP